MSAAVACKEVVWKGYDLYYQQDDLMLIGDIFQRFENELDHGRSACECNWCFFISSETAADLLW